MGIFYSATERGFFDTRIHGERMILIPDPDWAPPLVSVVLQPGQGLPDGSVVNTGDDEITLNLPDINAEPERIEVANGACLLPPDAVEIPPELHEYLLAGNAKGKLIVPDSNGQPVLVDPPPPADEVLSGANVDSERDRRIDAGLEFRGAAFQSRAGDRENIAGSAQLAFMAIVAGAQPGDLRWADAAADFFWIASDNTRVLMDAQTVVEFGKAAALSKQAHIIAGSNIKQMDPIPADYTDDKWWP